MKSSKSDFYRRKILALSRVYAWEAFQRLKNFTNECDWSWTWDRREPIGEFISTGMNGATGYVCCIHYWEFSWLLWHLITAYPVPAVIIISNSVIINKHQFPAITSIITSVLYLIERWSMIMGISQFSTFIISIHFILRNVYISIVHKKFIGTFDQISTTKSQKF